MGSLNHEDDVYLESVNGTAKEQKFIILSMMSAQVYVSMCVHMERKKDRGKTMYFINQVLTLFVSSV